MAGRILSVVLTDEQNPDRRRFFVDEALAQKFSNLFVDVLKDTDPEQDIEVARITARVFEAMVEWWRHHADDDDAAAADNVLSEWDRIDFFARFDAEERAGLTTMADYMQSDRLLDQCAAMEAEFIRGRDVASLERLFDGPGLLALTPQQLLEIEDEILPLR